MTNTSSENSPDRDAKTAMLPVARQTSFPTVHNGEIKAIQNRNAQVSFDSTPTHANDPTPVPSKSKIATKTHRRRRALVARFSARSPSKRNKRSFLFLLTFSCCLRQCDSLR